MRDRRIPYTSAPNAERDGETQHGVARVPVGECLTSHGRDSPDADIPPSVANEVVRQARTGRISYQP